MSEPVYTAADALRTELAVNSTVLPDADATRLIEQAEDQVDALLGGWPVDPASGRKIVQAQVEAWQWAKLARATTLLAAHLYRKPGTLTDREYRVEKVGDVWREDPLGGSLPVNVAAPLNDSCLRRLTGRATGRRTARPPWHDFSYNVD